MRATVPHPRAIVAGTDLHRQQPEAHSDSDGAIMKAAAVGVGVIIGTAVTMAALTIVFFHVASNIARQAEVEL